MYSIGRIAEHSRVPRRVRIRGGWICGRAATSTTLVSLFAEQLLLVLIYDRVYRVVAASPPLVQSRLNKLFFDGLEDNQVGGEEEARQNDIVPDVRVGLLGTVVEKYGQVLREKEATNRAESEDYADDGARVAKSVCCGPLLLGYTG